MVTRWRCPLSLVNLVQHRDPTAESELDLLNVKLPDMLDEELDDGHEPGGSFPCRFSSWVSLHPQLCNCNLTMWEVLHHYSVLYSLHRQDPCDNSCLQQSDSDMPAAKASMRNEN